MYKIMVSVAVLFLILCIGFYISEYFIKNFSKERIKSIDFSNGINKKEALILARDHLFKKKLDGKCFIFWAKVEDSFLYENSWDVNFFPSLGSLLSTPFSFVVTVNKNTGKIVSAGWNK